MPVRRRLARLIAPLCLLAVAGPAVAHPGHADSTPPPTWRTADGRTITGFLFKAEGGRAWIGDGSRPASIVPTNELDEVGQAAAARVAARAHAVNAGAVDVAADEPVVLLTVLAADAPAAKSDAPAIAGAFKPFAKVKTRWDAKYLYVESDGLPDHPMMKGITAWQQQVPLPQPYTGDNAWRIPLAPVPAKASRTIKGQFLRGAIALGVNGIPIFNPQNNRGEVSQEIGELDEWGGHCGRADDYHYHAAPLHLQAAAGKGMPVAYALDGYPIYGLTEPDGSPVGKLDECNGHATATVGYHYHASTKYPYVFAAFHGEVTEAGGQVDPQPRANPIRPAGAPLRGAKITDFKTVGKDATELTYEVAGKTGTVRYSPTADGGYAFAFEDPQGQKREETYQRRAGGGGGGGGGNGDRPREGERPPRRGGAANERADGQPRPQAAPAAAAPPAAANPKPVAGFVLRSSAVADDGALPVEFTGDGASATLPLEWAGAPAGTAGYALLMHHFDPEGNAKWYWVLYDIPAEARSLEKNVRGVGTLGTNSVNRSPGYAPPHSKGPGAKTYYLTLFALSGPPKFAAAGAPVDRAALLAAIADRTLGSACLTVTYDRTGVINNGGGGGGGGGNLPGADRRPGDGPAPQPRGDAGDRPPEGNGPPGGGGVRLLRREVEERINLTAEQRQQVADLERETAEKLGKILTPEQMKVLRESRPPAPPARTPK